MQRAIPRELSLGWLAGIIDGEGTIGCYFYSDRSKRSPRYGIWIVNIDLRIIEKCAKLFRSLGAEKVHIGLKNYKGGIGKRQCWYVQVNRKSDIKLILEAITPILVSKKEQAQLILKFFNDYPNLLFGRGNKSGKKNDNFKVYSTLIKKIKTAKERIGKPVETKR